MTDAQDSHALHDEVPPRAAAMVESLRAFGYSLRAAIADIVDNSITANASTVWIDMHWDGPRSWISIRDDGTGMSGDELRDAMQLGSTNPLAPRAADDLGRFGLGLKTASFSQCRRLTVASTDPGSGEVVIRRWDLDVIAREDRWVLLHEPHAETSTRQFETLAATPGTVVLWEVLDRLVDDSPAEDQIAHRRFLQGVRDVEHHLAMVFHRFLEGGRRIRMCLNGEDIPAWDPFMTTHPASQDLGEERLQLHGREIIVRPFVLPHKSKLTDDEHVHASGPRGWNAHQGFYIYRNRRLLVDGSWLGLQKQDEHCKLARVLVDLPNDLDAEWSIDVMKSKARPPGPLKDRMREIATVARARAKAIYSHRGKVRARKTSAPFVFAWLQKFSRNRQSYVINRDHPLVRDVRQLAGPEVGRVDALLRMLEESVPVPMIVGDHAERPDSHAGPFELSSESDAFAVMDALIEAFRREGLTGAAQADRLRAMEAFAGRPELVEAFLETRKDPE